METPGNRNVRNYQLSPLDKILIIINGLNSATHNLFPTQVPFPLLLLYLFKKFLWDGTKTPPPSVLLRCEITSHINRNQPEFLITNYPINYYIMRVTPERV